MKHYTKKTTLLLLMVCMAFCGCREKTDWSTNPPSPEKIAATNKVREELGIRQIKQTWTFYGREFGAEKWKTAKSLCKGVQYDENYEEILREADYYYTGRQVPSPDLDSAPTEECLTLIYDYPTKRFGLAFITANEEIRAMEYALLETTPKGLYESGKLPGLMGHTNEETLEVADKILKMWGLERL